MKKFWFYLLFIVGGYISYQFLSGSVVERAIMAAFVGFMIGLLVFPIAEIHRRMEEGIDVFATLESDPENVKAHMLFIMQYHGIEENLKELNEIFRNYPQWELQKWEVFRAWYKEQIDHMLKYPDIYGLRMKGTGDQYSTDLDPLYDPNAPDWAQFDRPYYDDDDYNENDDLDDFRNNDKQDKVSDAIAVGIGIGIASGLTGGSDCGS